MSSPMSKMLGPLGAEVLEALRRAGRPLTVRGVREVLNQDRTEALAYTTVMTVLARLADRRVLARRLVGRAYVYEALVTDAPELAVRELIRDYGEETIAHFVDKVSAELAVRARLTRLMGGQHPGG